MFARHAAVALVLLAAGSACSTARYRYVADSPGSGATKPHDGRSEVTYPVPGGKVVVSSRGVVEVEPGKNARRVPVVHLHVTISNESGKNAWELDSGQQKVSFPNGGQISPTFVNSDTSLPKVSVAPGQLSVLDLYFELPNGETSAADLESFSFHWQLDDDGQLAQQTTLFHRRPAPEAPFVAGPYEPYPPYPYAAPGWGPIWWEGNGPWGPVPRPAPMLPYRAR